MENEKIEFVLGKYIFNSQTQILTYDNNSYELSLTETQLLKLLSINLNELVGRSFALRTIWKGDDYFKGRSMDVYISRLRKYLKEDPQIKIANVHGKGFKLIINSPVEP